MEPTDVGLKPLSLGGGAVRLETPLWRLLPAIPTALSAVWFGSSVEWVWW
jgi:hypothetical protein